MSKVRYEAKSFTSAARQVAQAAEAICQDYARQGYRLTLRQLYYRFIATDAFPENRRWSLDGGKWRKDADGTKNAEPNYKWLGEIVSDARYDGLIDWSHIEDRTRSAEGGDYGWDSPAQAIQGRADSYNITHWDGQDYYVEVWVEKEALADVIGRPASALDVVSMACKGYLSSSAAHDSALRIRNEEAKGRRAVVLYLGDHDPSGVDMSRDIEDRLRTFRCDAEVRRIALNMDQVEAFDPPPSPAKPGDSRTAEYVERFGTEDCWELDALEPQQLEALITDEIESMLDRGLYDARIGQEERERRELTALADNWTQVRGYLIDQGLLDEPDGDGPDGDYEPGEDEDDE
jgi:hypothetical protein